jgi:cytochrome P450
MMSSEPLQPTLTSYPSPGGFEPAEPFLAHLREHAPVYELPDRQNVFLVTRYDDARYVLSRPELFLNRWSRRSLNGADILFGPRAEVASISEVDGADHQRMRRHAYTPITPGRLKAAVPLIEEIVDELISAFIGRGHAEFVSEFAHPLPLRLTRRLMDLPADDEPWLAKWAKAEAAGLSWASEEFRARQAENGAAMVDYLDARLRERAEDPGDDVLSVLAASQLERDGELNLPECRVQAAALLFGGINTPAHFLASILRRLLDDPDQMALVLNNRKLIPRMIEEALRLDGPNTWNRRVVAEDTELGGVAIPKGAFPLIMHGSANRDSERFECPLQLDVERANAREHLSFGYGTHSCLGAPLARMDAKVAYEHLFDRLGVIRLAPGNDFAVVESPQFHGLRRLEIEFDPA